MIKTLSFCFENNTYLSECVEREEMQVMII